jgi:putative tricarboxylic transport membrane protein
MKKGVKVVNIKTKSGIAVTVFGVIYTMLAYTMPKAAIGNPMAPAIFPLVLGIGLTIMGAFYFIRENKAWKEQVKREGVKEVDPATAAIQKKTNKLILLTCLSGIGYALFFESLGYIISTSFFIGIIMFAINGKKNWKLNISVALIFSVVVYFLFSFLLSIPLPVMPILEI